MPWSTALRARWISGSLTASSTFRSTSSSAPRPTQSISFPCCRARSRAMAGNRSRTVAAGLMRSWRAPASRASTPAASERSSWTRRPSSSRAWASTLPSAMATLRLVSRSTAALFEAAADERRQSEIAWSRLRTSATRSAAARRGASISSAWSSSVSRRAVATRSVSGTGAAEGAEGSLGAGCPGTGAASGLTAFRVSDSSCRTSSAAADLSPASRMRTMPSTARPRALTTSSPGATPPRARGCSARTRTALQTASMSARPTERAAP